MVKECDAVLLQFDRGEDLIYIRHIGRFGPDRLLVGMEFESQGKDVAFVKGYSSLLRVELSHRVFAGIDTREVESRIESVDWLKDPLMILLGYPFDEDVLKLAGVLVPGIFKDLVTLFESGEQGKLV